MPNRPNIKVGVEVDQTEVRRELSGLEKSFQGAGESISSAFSGTKLGAVTSGLSKITSGSALAAAGLGAMATALIAGGAALTKFVSAEVSASAQLKNISVQTNITSDTLSRLSSMVFRAGGDMESVADIANDLTEKFGDAKTGNEGLADSFRALGVDLGGTSEAALKQTILSLSTMADKEEAMFRGIELFGDKYKEIARQVAEGNNLITENPLFNQEMIDSSDELLRTLSDIKTEIVQELGPSFSELVTNTASFINHLKDTGELQNFIDYLQDIGTVTGWLSEKWNEFWGVTAETTISTFKTPADLLKDEIAEIDKEISAIQFSAATIGDAVRGGMSLEDARVKESEYVEKLNILQLQRIDIETRLTRLISGSTVATNDNTEATNDNTEAISNQTPAIRDESEALRLKNLLLEQTTERIKELSRYSISSNIDVNPFESLVESWMGTNSFITNSSAELIAGFNVPWFKTSPFERFAASGEEAFTNLKETQRTLREDLELSLIETINILDLSIEKIAELEPNTVEWELWRKINEDTSTTLRELNSDLRVLTRNMSDLEEYGEALVNTAWADTFKQFSVEYLSDFIPAVEGSINSLSTYSEEATASLNNIINALIQTGAVSEEMAEIMFGAVSELVEESAEGIAESFKDTIVDSLSVNKDLLINLFNDISDARVAGLEAENAAANKSAQEQLKYFRGSALSKMNLEKQLSAEQEKREDAINEKRKKMQIANAWTSALSTIPGIWGGFAEAFAPFGLAAPALISGFGGTATAMVLGSAAAQTAAIAKYENGGILDGPSHANGGIKTQYGELEGGEAIINRRSTALFRNELSAINVAGGGASFGNNDSMRSGVTVMIDKFYGNEGDEERLEATLIRLQNNGRTNVQVVG